MSLLRFGLNFLLLCSLFLGNRLSAQVVDNFSDGNFSANPTWAGDVDQFIISPELELQSDGDTTSATNREIYLSTANEAMNSTQWEFFVNPKVSTSSNNRIDFYLSSDLAELTGANTGYFVRIGGTPDEVALFRKDGLGNEVYVINGLGGSINSSSTNPTKVKVTRDASGNWSLYADYEGSGLLYDFIGSALDATYTQSAFAGIVVRYSSSNRQKYLLDDVYIGPIIVDNTAPSLVSVQVLSSSSIELRFSENVSIATAENTGNYVANNGLGEPLSATRSLTSFSRVTLDFATEFQDGIFNTLTVSAVEDLAGNDMNPEQKQFLYHRPQAFDIVINEIMADPDPAVLLPSIEYVELFNRTPYPISLDNWILEAGTNKKPIPAITILPDSFLVLSGLSGEEYFYDSVAVAGLSSFPALTNTGARVTLYTPDTLVISSVAYSDAWYGTSAKAEGGWSLEQISPYKPCEGMSNWRASAALWGGTPGKRNSVFQNTADVNPPGVDRVVVLSNDTIRVFFNESLLATSLTLVSDFSISDGIGTPVYLENYPPGYGSVKLALATPLQAGNIYTIAMTGNLRDCSGNEFDINSTGRFALPELALPGDLVINEVLSNPFETGADFVEIVNVSTKIIDLASIQLSKWDSVSNVADDVELIAPEGYLIFPGEYLVLTDDVQNIKSIYFTSNPTGFLEMSSFPTYNNDDGIVTLARISDQVKIDELVYSTDLHFALIDNLDGVSLERISPTRPASDKSNWNSAASTVGYATPAYRNSQINESTQSTLGEIQVSPELFSPDGDGFEDVLNISYAFDLAGFTGTLSIYDSNGRLVKYLLRNQLMGTSGTISWNGETDSNEKARLGIYVLVLDAFDLEGNTVKLKKPCVLGGKL